MSVRSFWDIGLQKCCDLEILVKVPWRSLKMSPFDRVHMTSYWCSIVTMALISCRFWDIQYRKISRPWNPSQEPVQGHSKWFHSTVWVWLILRIIIMFFFATRSQILRLKCTKFEWTHYLVKNTTIKNWLITDTTPRSGKKTTTYTFSVLSHDTTNNCSLFRRLVSVCPVGALYSHRWRYHQTSFSAL